jgi:hypothetical protein
MDKQERQAHQKEMESKLWSGDITTLTNKEIQDLVSNFFYQTFLIDINGFNFGYKTDDTGTYVKLILEGSAYGDIENLTQSEIEAIQQELEDEEGE